MTTKPESKESQRFIGEHTTSVSSTSKKSKKHMLVWKSAKKEKFYNPLTRRFVKVNGPTHEALCRRIRKGELKEIAKAIPECRDLKKKGRKQGKRITHKIRIMPDKPKPKKPTGPLSGAEIEVGLKAQELRQRKITRGRRHLTLKKGIEEGLSLISPTLTTISTQPFIKQAKTIKTRKSIPKVKKVKMAPVPPAVLRRPQNLTPEELALTDVPDVKKRKKKSIFSKRKHFIDDLSSI